MSEQRWQDWVTTFVGIWVLFSPLIIHYLSPEPIATSAVAWNYGFVGMALIIAGVAALSGYPLWEEWVDVILGAWLVASPWIFGFANMTATWNAVVAGAVVIVLAGSVLITGSGGR
jgi:hypothetical protein